MTVYWPCCKHCACNPKEPRPVHKIPCAFCQFLDDEEDS